MPEPSESAAPQPSGLSESELADEELETLWKGGSAPAFAVLFERYHARAFAFALRLVGDRQRAEDLAQRAFLNLLKRPPPGKGRASFRSLLLTVVRNESLNELKRKGRRREASLEVVAERSDGALSPEDEANRRESNARLERALEQLPKDEREIVLLREAEGLTFREVCEVTGLSRDAVRWRLTRGMEQLRHFLTMQGS
jgi:RNA polymerase sigma-70 factor, ECF subfamily